MPAATPVITPPGVTLTIDGLVLLQEPPGVISVKVTEAPWQSSVEPDMVAGRGLTTTEVVTRQPGPEL